MLSKRPTSSVDLKPANLRRNASNIGEVSKVSAESRGRGKEGGSWKFWHLIRPTYEYMVHFPGCTTRHTRVKINIVRNVSSALRETSALK
jgi:hypothetical protein